MESIQFYLKQILALAVCSNLIWSTVPPPSPTELSAPLVRLRKEIPPFARRAARIKNAETRSATLQITRELHSGRVSADTTAITDKTKVVSHLVSNNKQKPSRMNDLKQRFGAKLTGPVNTLGDRGLTFVENKGQFDQRVKFRASSARGTLWLTQNGIVFDFLRPKPEDPRRQLAQPHLLSRDVSVSGMTPNPPIEKQVQRHVIYQDFVGASGDVVIETKRVQQRAYNFFSGSDQSKWQTQVRGYSEIVYHNLWKGVDLRLYEKGADLEQEFILRPGAEARQVHIAYQGIQRLGVEKDGALLIETVAGEMRESAPRIYQEIASRRVMVEGRFKLLRANSYTFDIPAYDAKYALVIDPTLLYSTFLGGSAGNDPYGTDFLRGTHETVTGIAVDSSGNAYVAGYTYSPDFPTTPGALETTNSSGGFVSKLNAAGSALVYSTYLGHVSSISAIAVDSNGTAYVTGYTSDAYYGHAFPTTPNAYWPTNSNQACAPTDYFVTGINTTGDQLLYSSCFNSPTDPTYGQFPHGIALDSHGHIYVAGATSYPGFPTTPNAYEVPFSGMPESAFLTVFDTTSSGAASLYYSTILGVPSASNNPNGGTIATGVAVDSFGKAYLTGYTTNGFPVTPGAYQTTYSGSSCSGGVCNASTDSFVAKLDPTSSGAQSLIYSTYLGGIGSNIANAIAVDPSGNAHVTGATSSASFPTTPGAFQTATGYLGTSTAGFVSKLNAAGSNLVYSTYLFSVCAFQPCPGGPVSPNAIALDSFGDAYVVGNFRALQTSYPTTPDAFQNSYSSKLSGDFQEAFLTKLNPTGSGLVYSSYLGGSGDDVATAVAVDKTGDAYVVGHTASFDFPVTGFAFQPSMHGTGDAFVTKFPLGGAFRALDISPTSGGNAGVVTIAVFGSGFHAGVSVTLHGGAQDIVANPATVETAGLELTATFDLHGAVPGARDLVLINTDGTTLTLSNAFTVTNGGSPNLWIQFLGRPSISPNSSTSIDVVVGNQGSVDAVGVPVTLAGIPRGWTVTPDFPITAPPLIAGAAPINWSAVPVVFDSNSPLGQVIPLFLPFVASHSIVDLRFIVSANDIFPSTELQASVGTPFFQSPMSPAALNCLLSIFGTALSALGLAASLVPGGSCLVAVARLLASQFLTATKIGYGYANGLVNGGSVIFSMSWMMLSVTTFSLGVNCGAGAVIPGLAVIANAINTALSVALTLAACQPVLNSLLAKLAVAVLAPLDPNEKLGAAGVGQQRYLSGGSGPIPYSVYFENEPTATAPAQKVTVTDVLDQGLDLSTLTLGPITINGRRIPLPLTFAPAIGLYDAVTTLDLRPVLNLLVTIDARLGPATRVMTWTFTSIDATTGQPPADPTVGFLGVGTEGSVFFSANPVRGLATGTQIANQASVVFNSLASISTLPWINTLDNTTPISRVAALPATEPVAGFTVTWSGTDIGAGIQDFTIYVSDDGGPFTPFQANTISTSAPFSGQVGHTYGFYSIARDLVGNVESAKSAAEAITQVTLVTDTTPPVTIAGPSPGPNANGWNNTNVMITLSSADNEQGGTGMKQVTYTATGAQNIANTVVPGASASFTITTEGVTTVTFYGTDNAGNLETAKTLTIKLDKTPPSINCGAADRVWHASDVSISCTASDALSGLANPPDASFSLNTHVAAGTETSNAATGTQSVCDFAGNCASAGPIPGNMVDKKPSTISVSSPTAGGSYLLNQGVNATYSCSDGGSGLATCVGTVASGHPISTVPVGSKNFTVNATDNVGNVTSAQTVSYSVTYGICPLYDPTRAVQSGSTIPLKIQLCDANNADVSSSVVVVHGVSLTQASTNASVVLQASGNANPDNDFRFEATLGPTGGYIFNLSTEGLATGSYQLTFTASGDPLPHVLSFQVR
jgi:hypothetical protein